MEAHLVKTLGGFKGSDPQSEEACRAYGLGEIIKVDLKKPRNGKHHRKAMALLNLVYDNTDLYPSFDELLDDIKLKCGHFKKHINYRRAPDGTYIETVMFIPKSISFSAMSQEQFNPFYDRMLDVVLRDYFPELTKAGLEHEVMQFIHGQSNV